VPTEWLLGALLVLVPIIALLWRAVERESRRGPDSRRAVLPTQAEIQEENRTMDVPLGKFPTGRPDIFPPQSTSDADRD